MREIRSSISRNESIRKDLEVTRIKNGFMLGFMAKNVSIPLTTVSTWRSGGLNFIDEKLDRIEEFLKTYKR